MKRDSKGRFVKGQKYTEEERKQYSEIAKKTAWFKGHNFGECRKCGKTHQHYNQGKKLSDETKRKIGLKSIGRFPSEATRKKLSIKKMGEKNYWYGKKLSKEHRTKLTIKAKERSKNPEWLKKISDAKMGKRSHFYGKKHSYETKQIIRKKRSLQVFPAKDTKPELMMQLALDLENILYEKHVPVKTDTRYYQVDIFIDEKICLLIHGCYWHACPYCYKNKPLTEAQVKNKKRDNRIYPSLVGQGYQVIVVWEHDIMANNNHRIIQLIKLMRKGFA